MSDQGIGRSIAMWLASDGLDVAVNGVATSRTSPKPWPGKFDRRATAAGTLADVSELDDTKRKIRVANELGSLSFMVANAGIVQVKPLFEVTPEDFGPLIAVTVRGVLLCYKVAEHMV